MEPSSAGACCGDCDFRDDGEVKDFSSISLFKVGDEEAGSVCSFSETHCDDTFCLLTSTSELGLTAAKQKESFRRLATTADDIVIIGGSIVPLRVVMYGDVIVENGVGLALCSSKEKVLTWCRATTFNNKIKVNAALLS